MFKKSAGILAVLAFAGWTGSANATLIIDVTEVGGDVVFTTTGSLDLTGATSVGSYSNYGLGFIAGGSNWYVAGSSQSLMYGYAMTSYDGAFGTSTNYFDSPSSVSGDDFFIWGQYGTTAQVGLTRDYVSNSTISSLMTFSSATIAGFTMIEGTYNYAIPSDNIILKIGKTVGVPEPASLALFGIGLAGLGFSRKKMKN